MQQKDRKRIVEKWSKERPPTKEELDALLRYDRETGELFFRHSFNSLGVSQRIGKTYDHVRQPKATKMRVTCLGGLYMMTRRIVICMETGVWHTGRIWTRNGYEHDDDRMEAFLILPKTAPRPKKSGSKIGDMTSGSLAWAERNRTDQLLVLREHMIDLFRAGYRPGRIVQNGPLAVYKDIHICGERPFFVEQELSKAKLSFPTRATELSAVGSPAASCADF